MSLETRKTRLLAHIYDRLLDDDAVTFSEWIDVLDAIRDVLDNDKEGMKEWTITGVNGRGSNVTGALHSSPKGTTQLIFK